MRQHASNWIRYLCNWHVPGDKPDIFVLSTPRSGSTWLMEAIAADRRLRPFNEPLNIRKVDVVRKLGIDDWGVLQQPAALPVIERYLEAISRGKLGYSFRTPRPGQRGYHFLSDRVVFKILFGLEEHIDWIKSAFGAQVVCLIRHPIPVSISREETPRLAALMKSEYLRRLPGSARKTAERIFRTGDRLERAQLDWCLQNGPLIDGYDKVDLFITYEQLVQQTGLVATRLIEQLDLECGDRVSASFDRLSGSVSKSSQESLQILAKRQADSLGVLAKWRSRVDEATEGRLMAIPADLGIDIYRAGSILPHPRFWIGDQYPQEHPSQGDADARRASP